MPLNEEEVDQLHGGAECRIHHHPKEFPDLDDLVNMEAVNPGEPITTNETLGNSRSLVVVDTSAGNITITMPPAQNGREYQVIKGAAANVLSIVPSAGETVLGSSTGLQIFNFGTCVHLKSVTSNDWMVI